MYVIRFSTSVLRNFINCSVSSFFQTIPSGWWKDINNNTSRMIYHQSISVCNDLQWPAITGSDEALPPRACCARWLMTPNAISGMSCISPLCMPDSSDASTSENEQSRHAEWAFSLMIVNWSKKEEEPIPRRAGEENQHDDLNTPCTIFYILYLCASILQSLYCTLAISLSFPYFPTKT